MIFKTQTDLLIIFIAGIFTLLVVAGFLIYFITLYQRKQYVKAKEKQYRQSQFQQDLLHIKLEIQEQTFKTISQEIHDNIGQTLSLAKLNLATVNLLKEEKAAEKIDDAKALISKAIQDLRELSKTLNTETLAAAGLLHAIETELHMLQKTGALQTTLHVSGTPVRPDAQKELVLFRIVQEALHNAIQHGGATSIRVDFFFEHEGFKLLIADNGSSVEPGVNAVMENGLRTMQNRSNLIGAACAIERTAKGGTTVCITLPKTT